MDTFALVLTMCMIQSPDKCVERHIPLPGANELTCTSVAQAEAVKALTPGWKLIRWGCEKDQQ